jgi:uncharacterized cupin superfamily protein
VAPARTPRPPCIVALADVEPETGAIGEFDITERDTGRAAGSVRTGLRHLTVAPGKLNCPPHWHANEHELFVVLEGGGELLLYDNAGAIAERHALRAGHCVARPGPGRRQAHALLAGEQGMTYLAYGMRHGGEIVYYPRSRKAWLGGVLVRVEPMEDYWEGET